MEPNEIREDEDDNDKGDEEEKSEEESEGQEVKCQFKEVKLCSRNGAFLRLKKDGKQYLYFATQNTRVKGEVPK